ncbi:MAG: hypothetical protein WD423_16330 [Rhodothermales bacterium]
MKLRLSGDSIRLRLSPSDLAKFEKVGHVDESVPLRGGPLHFTLQAAKEVDDLDAVLEGTSLRVRLPAAWVPAWIASDRVGFEASIPLERGGTLNILVEKDFRCLHKESTVSDAFPHPDA